MILVSMTCCICGQKATPENGYVILGCSDGNERYVCCPSCLVDYAWQVKEKQSKLSKSKQEMAPIITLGPYGPLKEGF